MNKIKVLFLVPISLLMFYYLSLSIHGFIQIHQSNKFSREFLRNKPIDDEGTYLYTGGIYFRAARAKYQSYSARVYIYLNLQNIQDRIEFLSADVTRDCYGELQKSVFSYSQLEQAPAHFQLDGYQCYSPRKTVIKFYPDYNEVFFKIHGIQLKNPEEDMKIMLFFNNTKGRLEPVTFLLRTLGCLGVVILFFIAEYAIKKLKEKWCHS